MRYGLVIFDFDGTLAASFPWFLSVLGPLAARHGLPQVDAAEAAALRRLDTRAILQRMRVPPWKLPAIGRELRRLKAAAEIPLVPGVAPALAGLAAAGVPLAMVSSDSEANIRRTLGPSLSALIGHFACDAGLFGKAAKLRRVVRAAGVAPAAAVYVGDETRDAEAAARAGLAFAAVGWGYAAPEALRARQPAHWLESPGDILRLLLLEETDAVGARP